MMWNTSSELESFGRRGRRFEEYEMSFDVVVEDGQVLSWELSLICKLGLIDVAPPSLNLTLMNESHSSHALLVGNGKHCLPVPQLCLSRNRHRNRNFND